MVLHIVSREPLPLLDSIDQTVDQVFARCAKRKATGAILHLLGAAGANLFMSKRNGWLSASLSARLRTR